MWYAIWYVVGNDWYVYKSNYHIPPPFSLHNIKPVRQPALINSCYNITKTCLGISNTEIKYVLMITAEFTSVGIFEMTWVSITGYLEMIARQYFTSYSDLSDPSKACFIYPYKN